MAQSTFRETAQNGETVSIQLTNRSIIDYVVWTGELARALPGCSPATLHEARTYIPSYLLLTLFLARVPPPVVADLIYTILEAHGIPTTQPAKEF